MMKKTKAWIEAMRLRTLPVSVAGVIAGTAYAIMDGCLRLWPAMICLIFAVLAQIASNFANEYYDFKAGLDRPGREGPRRGVTEGDITPTAMKHATYGVLIAACAAGCSLVYWGGWWLVPVGMLIALGVVAYSAGPYPLSRHGLGEVAVLFFFGIIPVNLTYYLQAADLRALDVAYPGYFFSLGAFMGSVAVGLMGANVLIINNYRDVEDDAAVAKRTLAVRWGTNVVSAIYLINGYVAAILISLTALSLPLGWNAVTLVYLACHTFAWLRMLRLKGRALNPFLGITAMLMLFYCLGLFIACCI